MVVLSMRQTILRPARIRTQYLGQVASVWNLIDPHPIQPCCDMVYVYGEWESMVNYTTWSLFLKQGSWLGMALETLLCIYWVDYRGIFAFVFNFFFPSNYQTILKALSLFVYFNIFKELTRMMSTVTECKSMQSWRWEVW